MLSGCLSLGMTQSAQTLRPSQIQHAFGLEWFSIQAEDADYPLPFALPFYAVRVGMSEGVDLGFRTNATFTNIGVDLKIQPLDTEFLDVAIDPTLQYAWAWGWAHLPLLVGLNLGESVQLTLSGRIAYALPMLDDTGLDELEDTLGSNSQTIVGGGAALYLRVGRTFAIVPEIQAVRGFGDTDPVVLSFILGFTLGDQPGIEPEPEPPLIPPTPLRPSGPPAHPYGPPGVAPPPGGAAPGPPPTVPPTTPPGYGPPAAEPAPPAPEPAPPAPEAAPPAPEAAPPAPEAPPA